MRHYNKDELLQRMKEQGSDNTGQVPVAEIPFRREFRAACEANTCGKYGTTWMCPPEVGEIDELIGQAKAYTQALVYQSIHPIEDSFDIEGMLEAGRRHQALSLRIDGKVRSRVERYLHLGAGSCGVCSTCAKKDELPCRRPDLAMASLEAYGIAVSELAELCGLRYINGVNTVTYFGAVLL